MTNRNDVFERMSFLMDKHLGKCFYCSVPVIRGKGIKPKQKLNSATIDHLTPMSRGGSKMKKENQVLSCYSCNLKKGNMTLIEYQQSSNNSVGSQPENQSDLSLEKGNL